MAEGAIPWSDADRYATRHELTGDDYDRFLDLIRALDAEYLKHRERQQKSGK